MFEPRAIAGRHADGDVEKRYVGTAHATAAQRVAVIDGTSRMEASYMYLCMQFPSVIIILIGSVHCRKEIASLVIRSSRTTRLWRCGFRASPCE